MIALCSPVIQITVGRLVKLQTPRNPKVTDSYRSSLVERATRQWGVSDPRLRRLEMRMERGQADHMHELQLGGFDHPGWLTMLDSSVNASVGAQIMHQLRRLPNGVKIRSIKVVEQ